MLMRTSRELGKRESLSLCVSVSEGKCSTNFLFVRLFIFFVCVCCSRLWFCMHVKLCLLCVCVDRASSPIYSVVEFATREDMLRAVDKYDGYEINGKKIRLIDVRSPS